MIDIGDELRATRRKMGKSQKDMANEFGLPQTTWANYETGIANPPMKILFSLAERGYPIKGLTTSVLNDMVEDGKISKTELQKRLEIARAMAEKVPPDTDIDDEWGRKVNEEYERQNSLEEQFIGDLEKVIYKVMKSHIKTIGIHESRLTALEAKYANLAYLPENKTALEPGANCATVAQLEEDSYTAEPEPEYVTVPFREDIAAGPPIGQSEDESLVVDVPLRFIKTKLSDYYVLRIRGNSMIDALIPDGSMVLIRKSGVPQDAKIQVVQIDGRATLKRLREGEDHSWTLYYEDGTGRSIPMGAENLVQGDFVTVLPPLSQPRIRGE